MEVIYTAQLQPDVMIGNWRIGEPMVSLTAILMSLVCFYAWFQLGKFRLADPVWRFFRLFFLSMAVSGFLGGLFGHAFLYRFPFIVKMPGWVTGIVAVAFLGQVSIERLQQFQPNRFYRLLSAVNIAGFLLSIGILSATLWFPIVEFHTAFGLLGMVGAIELVLWRRLKLQSSRLMLTAIPFAMLAAAVHIAKFSISPWFTFFDIGHVFVCGTFWLIYQSALVYKEEETIKSNLSEMTIPNNQNELH